MFDLIQQINAKSSTMVQTADESKGSVPITRSSSVKIAIEWEGHGYRNGLRLNYQDINIAKPSSETKGFHQ